MMNIRRVVVIVRLHFVHVYMAVGLINTCERFIVFVVVVIVIVAVAVFVGEGIVNMRVSMFFSNQQPNSAQHEGQRDVKGPGDVDSKNGKREADSNEGCHGEDGACPRRA